MQNILAIVAAVLAVQAASTNGQTCADLTASRTCARGSGASDKPCAWTSEGCVAMSSMDCSALSTRTCRFGTDCQLGYPINKFSRSCMSSSDQASYTCSQYISPRYCARDMSKVPDGSCVWDSGTQSCQSAESASCDLLKTKRLCDQNTDCSYGRTPSSKGRSVCYETQSASSWTCSSYVKDKNNCNKNTYEVSEGPCFFTIQGECKPLSEGECEEMDKTTCGKSGSCTFRVPINQRSVKCLSNTEVESWTCADYTTTGDCNKNAAQVTEGPCAAIPGAQSFECKALSTLVCTDMPNESLCDRLEGCEWSNSGGCAEEGSYSSTDDGGDYSSEGSGYTGSYTGSYSGSYSN